MKSFLAALLMSALCLSTNLAQADSSCSDLELDAPGGAFSNVPVLDQGDEGSCQYNVLAQLIDAYRFSHGDTNTSLHTSAEYLWNLHLTQGDSKHGFEQILPYVVANGICSRSTCVTQDLQPVPLPSQIGEQSSDGKVWASDWSLLGEDVQDARLAFINSSLLQNKGIAIAIKSCIFYRQNLFTKGCTEDSEMDHVVIVIGRKTDPRTGKCQFKIRNSWGKDCESGQPNFLINSLGQKCDHGNFWIDGDQVMNSSAYFFTY